MREKEMYFKVAREIEELREQMIDFQKNITKYRAISPNSGGEGEWDKALFIREFLQKRGITEIVQIDAPDHRAKKGKRPNLIVHIPGKSQQRTIWIMAHTDVVPEGDQKLWNSDPWEVMEKDGKLFGRGTEDNQQSLTSAIFCVLALKKLDIRPEYDVKLILVSDEETGSQFGLGYLMSQHREMFSESDLIIVPDAGEHDSRMIEVAETSIVWFRFQTEGKQCHASTPEKGINAFKAGSHLAVKLQRLYEIFDGRNDLFAPPHSTFEPTKKEANVPNVNTIPGQDVFHMDCRLLPQYKIDQLFKEVRKICDEVEEEFGVKIKITTTQREAAAPGTAADAPVVHKLKNAIKTVYNVEALPQGIGGGTVAAIFRRAGLPAAVWSTIDDVCHQPNEYCVINHMVNDAKVFAHLCLQKD